jgi:hypothetical protein
MVGALSLTLVACGSKSTTAWCVDRFAPAVGQTKGGYKVVPDSLCNTSDIDRGSDNGYSRYFWYYGGKRYSSGGNSYISGGRTYRPSNVSKVKSSAGHTLRGGFGGHGHSGS